MSSASVAGPPSPSGRSSRCATPPGGPTTGPPASRQQSGQASANVVVVASGTTALVPAPVGRGGRRGRAVATARSHRTNATSVRPTTLVRTTTIGAPPAARLPHPRASHQRRAEGSASDERERRARHQSTSAAELGRELRRRRTVRLHRGDEGATALDGGESARAAALPRPGRSRCCWPTVVTPNCTVHRSITEPSPGHPATVAVSTDMAEPGPSAGPVATIWPAETSVPDHVAAVGVAELERHHAHPGGIADRRADDRLGGCALVVVTTAATPRVGARCQAHRESRHRRHRDTRACSSGHVRPPLLVEGSTVRCAVPEPSPNAHRARSLRSRPCGSRSSDRPERSRRTGRC